MASTGIHRYSGDELGNVSLGQIGFDMLSIGSDWTLITPADAHEAKVAYGGVWKKIDSNTNHYIPKTTDDTLVTMLATAGDLLTEGDYVGINDEIMQIYDPSPVVGAFYAVRAQFGTVAALHDATSQMYLYKRVGDHFKYWNSGMNCSEFSEDGLALEVQAKPYGYQANAFDNIVSNNSIIYDPSNNASYITLATGELLMGRFSKIAIQKPTAGLGTAKLNRG